MVHVGFFNVTFNLLLIAVIIFNLAETPVKKTGYMIAFLGGLYSDIFSFRVFGFFGFYALVFLLITFFLKFFLSRYVRFSFTGKK